MWLNRPKNLLVVLLAFWGVAVAQAGTVRQIVLVQNSGWMLPFYEDPQNRFLESVADFSGRILPFSSEVLIATFNQSAGDNKSPMLQFRGADAGQITQSIRNIHLARKSGGAYADTDFREALVSAISEYTPGQPALIWLITNNRNSPNNSPETVLKNKQFYTFLQETPEIARIVAYPLQLAVVGQSRRDYSANGLMFYGLAYGDAAEAVLRQMLDSKRVFGQANVARLKPLDAEALTFVPKSVETPGVTVRLSDQDKKTLILTMPADSQARSARLTGKLRNDFYPYDIASATPTLNATGFLREGGTGLNAQLKAPDSLNIAVGDVSPDVSVDLQIPPLPSMFSPEVVFGAGYRLAGVLQFELRDQRLVVSPSFVAYMNELFPRDPLPDLLIPGESSRSSITQQPMVIVVEYPIWPLLALGSVVLLAVGGLVGGFILMGRSTQYKVSIDGHERTIALKPFGSAELRNIRGERVGTLRRGLGRPQVQKDEKFKTISIAVR